MEIKFDREKETKNTIRFAEVMEAGKPPVLGTVYVQKWFAGDSKKITITVEKE